MKILLASSLVLCSLLVSGCDFFRALAGRPLSQEIDAKREKIELSIKEKEAKTADSLAVVRKSEADSLQALSRLTELSAVLLEAEGLGGLVDGQPSGYRIVLGSFKNGDNAAKLVEKVRSCGYDAGILAFRNGMYAVTMENHTGISELTAAYERILNEKFCPNDVWILKN